MSFIQKAKEESLNIREGRTIEVLNYRSTMFKMSLWRLGRDREKTVCAGISDLATVVTAHSTDLIIWKQE